MIYSFVMLYNELNLLRMRIEEERPYVDKIVIVEASKTFNNISKQLFFPIDEYKNDEKIVYLPINKEDDLKGWHKKRYGEIFQRNYAQKHFSFEPDDCIICTDIDETIRGDEIPRIAEEVRKRQYVILSMNLYYYFLNAYRGLWTAPFAADGEMCSRYTFNDLRWNAAGVSEWEGMQIPRPEPKKRIIVKGGHFCYMDEPEKIAKKIREGCAEFRGDYWSDANRVKDRVMKLYDLFDRRDERGEMHKLVIINIDESYPIQIQKNIDAWKEYIA